MTSTTTTKTTTASTTITKPPTKLKTIEDWRNLIVKHWKKLKAKAEAAKLGSAYEELVFMTLWPIMPRNKTTLRAADRILKKVRYCEPFRERFNKIWESGEFDVTLKTVVQSKLNLHTLSPEERAGLDWLLVSTGALTGLETRTAKSKKFLTKLDTALKEIEQASAVRVQAGMISAGQNIVIAGENATIVTDHYQGSKAALRSYLAQVRTEWNLPATSIHPRSTMQSQFALHQLFIPHDIWVDTSEYANVGSQQLKQRRFKAIDQNIDDGRQAVLEAIALHPLIVITGGAGTGKSSLCHYIATALAYACDSKAERSDSVDGLSLLSPAWIHGAYLPLFVSLRDFCNDKEVFPKSAKEATANTIINYLKKQTGSFAKHLEAFLTDTDVETHGTVLLLDGLDEIYNEQDRILLRRIIENWAARFKGGRIILTSRTYAYRHDASWRLSRRFNSVELAPFTWRQMRNYIDRWYLNAAENRPGAFGGRAKAKEHAKIMAQDLTKSVLENKSLWALARHPLMLALITLIHEDYKYLPSKRAELYEQTVELLDRWNIPSPADKLHEKLATINLERMRAALKMLAFELQSEQQSYLRYPTTIERGKLLDKLMQQQLNGDGLGANIEDVLEYLATRNGILVTDEHDVYRFPHLSIQEYLAACALIEFYDECKMPDQIKPSQGEIWTFPENVVTLLRHNPYRWRQVALFAGSIIAAGKGQDPRWQLIDELLPAKLEEDIPETDLHSICIASEIWSESWLKARTQAQHGIRRHLAKCLQTIRKDERIDAPEREKNRLVLARLETDL